MQGQSNEVLTLTHERDGVGDSSSHEMDRTRLIINYIPRFVVDEELQSIFAKVGQIEDFRIMRNYRTCCCLGYGFVKYVTPEDAAKAIGVIDGMNFGNKRLKVAYSRPRKDTKDSNLYIANLPENFTEEDIDRVFGEFGEIIQRTILKDKVTGLPRHEAFVRFAKSDEAQAAIAALDGKKLLEDAMLPLYIRVRKNFF